MRIADFNNIQGCIDYTESKISQMREALSQYDERRVSVVLNGSFARKEASAESDADFFILATDEIPHEEAEAISDAVRDVLVRVTGKPPSPGGPFGSVERSGTFASTIGGDKDENHSITRRILFLTEGRAVVGEALFARERDAIIRKYIRKTITDHQLAMFLLNDIIRYYRTVCVDFEHKTTIENKPWGIRNIKPVFSRKMLYFGGILICAETAQKTYDQKTFEVLRLMSMTPIERIVDICGPAARNALKEYDHFLGEIAKSDVRAHLDAITEDRSQHTEEFKALKNRGHYFTMGLMSALTSTYPPSHPIHRALIL